MKILIRSPLMIYLRMAIEVEEEKEGK